MTTAPLRLVHPGKPKSATTVTVELALQGSTLDASFAVKSCEPEYVNPKLSKQGSQWGLWDWDVVELFVQPSAACSTYYEFQVSPLNQFFELEIFEPRKRFNKEFVSGFLHDARLISTGQGWSARLHIPLEKIGWDGNPASVRGDAFAILGRPEQRQYFSLFLPDQEKPDFHLPKNFQELIRV